MCVGGGEERVSPYTNRCDCQLLSSLHDLLFANLWIFSKAHFECASWRIHALLHGAPIAPSFWSKDHDICRITVDRRLLLVTRVMRWSYVVKFHIDLSAWNDYVYNVLDLLTCCQPTGSLCFSVSCWDWWKGLGLPCLSQLPSPSYQSSTPSLWGPWQYVIVEGTKIYWHYTVILTQGLFEVAGGLGFALGPPLGGALYQVINFSCNMLCHVIMYTTRVLILCVVVLWMFTLHSCVFVCIWVSGNMIKVLWNRMINHEYPIAMQCGGFKLPFIFVGVCVFLLFVPCILLVQNNGEKEVLR